MGNSRDTSSVMGSGNQVNSLESYQDTFQRIFVSAENALDRANFNFNLLIDRSQIGHFESLYRELEFHFNSLIPYVGFHFNSLNFLGIIYTVRNLQTRLEDILINFYQNLPEREQLKVVFTLPQFQNRSFLQAINRSLNISKKYFKRSGIDN